jgi:hypothetical protein
VARLALLPGGGDILEAVLARGVVPPHRVVWKVRLQILERGSAPLKLSLPKA